MRSGTGRGRHGPGLLGATGRPAVPPGSPPPVSGGATPAAAAGGGNGTADARPRDEAPPGQQLVDFRQGRWLPRHQPWNAASVRGAGGSTEALSAQLDELQELAQSGLLTAEEFDRRRARLLST